MSNARIQIGLPLVFDDDVQIGCVKSSEVFVVKGSVVGQGQKQALTGVGDEAKPLLLHNRYGALSDVHLVSCHVFLLEALKYQRPGKMT